MINKNQRAKFLIHFASIRPYIRRYGDVQTAFWTSFVRLIYGIFWRDSCSNAFQNFIHLKGTRKTKKMELKELSRTNPANICLLKVNKRNTRKRFEICSKLTIKTLKWHLSWELLHNYCNTSNSGITCTYRWQAFMEKGIDSNFMFNWLRPSRHLPAQS